MTHPAAPPGRSSRWWSASLVVVLALTPFLLTDFWLSVLNFAAIASIGAVGLNILTGYTGQISLGHAFFIGLGAYTAGSLGGDLHMPVLVWLPAAGLLGALVGSVTGWFVLRLRGFYLAIITVGLVFVGHHVYLNIPSITGGSAGRNIPSPMIGGFDIGSFGAALGLPFTRDQSFFYLVVPLAAVAAIFAKNVVRSNVGRAFRAVRDRDTAASVIGVNLVRYKIAAFAMASFYAASAGALLGSYIRHVSPEQFDIVVSIQYVAMIIVGGVGTILGSILGALFIVSIPRVVEIMSPHLPFLSQAGLQGGVTVSALNQLIFGLMIVIFLVLEPRGLAGTWDRVRAYVAARPSRS